MMEHGGGDVGMPSPSYILSSRANPTGLLHTGVLGGFLEGHFWAVTFCLTPTPSPLPRWCFKRQLVDLVMEGVWQELLDSAQIEICVADW